MNPVVLHSRVTQRVSQRLELKVQPRKAAWESTSMTPEWCGERGVFCCLFSFWLFGAGFLLLLLLLLFCIYVGRAPHRCN